MIMVFKLLVFVISGVLGCVLFVMDLWMIWVVVVELVKVILLILVVFVRVVLIVGLLGMSVRFVLGMFVLCIRLMVSCVIKGVCGVGLVIIVLFVVSVVVI